MCQKDAGKIANSADSEQIAPFRAVCSGSTLFAQALTLSHLSAHMENRLLHENLKTIPKFLSVKKTFQNCNPPDFKF